MSGLLIVMNYHIASLARGRSPDLLTELRRRCTADTDHMVSLSANEIQDLLGKYPLVTDASPMVSQETVSQRIPRSDWPLWAVALEKLAQPGDSGLGDVVARQIGPGGEAFKAWYRATFGRSCGCADRQRWLNARYPLPADVV